MLTFRGIADFSANTLLSLTKHYKKLKFCSLTCYFCCEQNQLYLVEYCLFQNYLAEIHLLSGTLYFY